MLMWKKTLFGLFYTKRNFLGVAWISKAKVISRKNCLIISEKPLFALQNEKFREI